MALDKKILRIFQLMKYFIEGREISRYSEGILDEFECDGKTLERYLKEIEELYPHIVKIKKSRQTYYKLEKASEIFLEFIKQEDDISWIVSLLQEGDKKIFQDLNTDTRRKLKNISNRDKDIFLFRNSPFEDLTTIEQKKIFSKLKVAVKNNEYRDITYFFNKEEKFSNVKCLKLIFANNNWYLAHEKENGNFGLFRVAFIKEVDYGDKDEYQKSVNEKYQDYFENFQNAMSLQEVGVQIALLKASPSKAKYFKEDMKKFYPSQKFLKENEDRSIEFTIDYTQPIEILPFIKSWIPDVEILEPKELKENLAKDMKLFLEKKKS